MGLLLMRGVTGQHLVVDGGCSVLGYELGRRFKLFPLGRRLENPCKSE